MTNHTPGRMVCHGNEMIQEEAGVTLAYFGANGTYGEKSYRITDVEAAANAEYAARAWNCFDRLLVAAKALMSMTEYELENCENIEQSAFLALGLADLKTLVAEAEGGGDVLEAR